ncbi:MAG TPA: DUF308 domain-containing protein, partial [bacterium]|nr:DUF308 domain-containing protein [bacterium]
MRHRLPDRAWWILGARGVLGLLLGAACVVFLLFRPGARPDPYGLAFLFSPFETLAAILVVLGAYAFLDGLFAFLLGIQTYGKKDHWWSLILEGMLSVWLGIWTWLHPESVAVLVLLYWIGAWAFFTGVLEVFQSLRPEEPGARMPFLT